MFKELRIFEFFLHDSLIELVGQMKDHSEAGAFSLLQELLHPGLQDFGLSQFRNAQAGSLGPGTCLTGSGAYNRHEAGSIVEQVPPHRLLQRVGEGARREDSSYPRLPPCQAMCCSEVRKF
jgi:hypothetical protein